jgi:hypothetical protein
MQQEDYIKRQIDQLGRVLGKILADLLGPESHGTTMENVESVIRDLTGKMGVTEYDPFSRPPGEFIEQLKDAKGFNEDNFNTLADIFILLAECTDPGTSMDQKQTMYGLALAIFEHLDQVSHTYSFDRHLKMDKIKQAPHR